jgi:hypothetical protein
MLFKIFPILYENNNEDDTNEVSDIDDEPDDSSLKDIYTGQTFTTLKHPYKKIG